MGAIFATFLSMVMVLVAMTAIGNSFARAKAIEQQHAAQYLLPAEQSAKAQAQIEIANDVQNSHSIGVVLASQTPAPACGAATLANGSACPYKAVTHTTLSGSSTAGSSVGTSSCNNTNTTIAETCVSYAMTTTISNATNGATLVTRSYFVTYRVFNAPPYAVVAGEAATGATLTSQEADIGGCNTAAQTTATCGSNDGTAPVDTINHSYTQCQDGFVSCTGQGNQYHDTTSLSASNSYNSSNQTTGTWAH